MSKATRRRVCDSGCNAAHCSLKTFQPSSTAAETLHVHKNRLSLKNGLVGWCVRHQMATASSTARPLNARSQLCISEQGQGGYAPNPVLQQCGMCGRLHRSCSPQHIPPMGVSGR